DAIDAYCPPGTLRATFTFGTASGSFTSMSMDIREATDLTATYTPYNATVTPNGDTLTATGTNHLGGASTTGGGACVGGNWTLHLARSPVTGAGGCTVKIRPDRIAAPNGVPAPPPAPGRV